MNCEECKFKDEVYVPPEIVENCDILFVGQNPGAKEQEDGYPFSVRGASGELIRKYLAELDAKGVTYSVTNALKCGTPKNKTPTKKETEVCYPKLKEDIERAKPDLVVALGKVAYRALTGDNSPITEKVGNIYYNYDPPILVALHPAIVSRGGFSAKAKAKFEKGILPALKYFDKDNPVNIIETDCLVSSEKYMALDLETDCIKPHKGKIKTVSVSDGEKTYFTTVENHDKI